MVIIDQQGTSYEIGQIIDGTKPFLLAVDKRVTLLSHSGELIKLVGPYSDKPTLVETKNNARSDMLSNIGQIIGRQRKSTNNLGTVRSAQGSVTIPDPWALIVDANTSDNHCIPNVTGRQAYL